MHTKNKQAAETATAILDRIAERGSNVSFEWLEETIHKTRQDYRPTIEETIKQLFRHLNGDRHKVRSEIRFWLSSEHRTLQQALVRDFIVPVLEELKREGDLGFYDARNEGSYQFATKALEANEETFLPLI